MLIGWSGDFDGPCCPADWRYCVGSGASSDRALVYPLIDLYGSVCPDGMVSHEYDDW